MNKVVYLIAGIFSVSYFSKDQCQVLGHAEDDDWLSFHEQLSLKLGNVEDNTGSVINDSKWLDRITKSVLKGKLLPRIQMGCRLPDASPVLNTQFLTPTSRNNSLSLGNVYVKEDQGTLEKQIAYHLGLHDYHAMDVEKLEKLLEGLKILDDMRGKKIVIQEKIVCAACQSLIRNLQRNAISVEIVGTAVCNLYFSLATWTVNDFCQEIVRINKPILEYISKNSKILNPEYACSVLLQNENCYYSHPSLTWLTEIPEGGPIMIPTQSGYYGDSSEPIKILHLSDIHISHDYEEGGVSDCGYPVCCKKGLGNPIRGRNAGLWGDYSCDIPPWLFLNTLNFINNTHKDIDLVYFTGDIIDHSIWKDSKEQNSNEIASTFRVLAESFPNVAVIPAIGNHETAPLNIFAPEIVERFSQKWLYELNANLWRKWLPQEALTTVAKQGYYSVLANRKLRIIVLNNNICYIYNWWLLYDTHFLKEQIEFLKKELQDAENNGQFVHILAHLFPGEKECIEPWEVNYNSLITRFAHIIKGQFFGHTHTDGLKVFYSKIDGKPNNVGYNGASLTPFVKYNPNYKIISVDPSTFDVLDIETYYFNLTEANLYPNRTPRWKKLYSIKEAYSFSDLSPANFDWLAKRLSQDGYLFDQYWRYYVREGDASLKDGCNEECRRTLISSITRTESLTSQ